MKRSHRIAINLGGPALVASILVIIPEVVETQLMREKSIVDFSAVPWFFVILLYAYGLAAIPSLLHTWLMERVYRRYPDHTWAAVGCSSLSGFGAGIIIAGVFLASAQVERAALLIYTVLGLLVGFILGAMVLLFSRRGRGKDLASSVG